MYHNNDNSNMYYDDNYDNMYYDNDNSNMYCDDNYDNMYYDNDYREARRNHATLRESECVKGRRRKMEG